MIIIRWQLSGKCCSSRRRRVMPQHNAHILLNIYSMYVYMYEQDACANARIYRRQIKTLAPANCYGDRDSGALRAKPGWLVAHVQTLFESHLFNKMCASPIARAEAWIRAHAPATR